MSFLLELAAMSIWVLVLGGLPVLVSLGYEWVLDRYEDYIKGAYSKKQKFVVLRIFPPIYNNSSMHQMEEFFNSVWSIYRERTPYKLYTLGRSYENITIEFHSKGGLVGTFLRVNTINQPVVTAKLTEQFPGIKIVESADPMQELPKEWTRKGRYTQMYGTDMKTVELATGKETDLFPLKSWKAFQNGTDQPIADPSKQLFEILQRVDIGAYVVVQFVLRPLFNKTKIKEWMAEYHKRRKEFLTMEDVSGHDKRRIQIGTAVSNRILNGISRKINSLNYATKIRVVILAEPQVKIDPLQNLVASYFVQFQSEMVRLAPQSQTETTFSPDGNYLGVLGPQIELFLNNTVYEQERYLREKMVYTGLLKRNLDIGSKPYYLDTESLTSMIHFPFVKPEQVRERKLQIEAVAPEQKTKYEYVFGWGVPEDLPA